ncbi:hypothetical protein ACWGOK_41215 [Streptomyces eurythermus]
MSQPYATQPATKPFNWRRWALWTTAASVVSFSVCGAIGAATKEPSTDPAACKAAMAQQLHNGITAGSRATTSTRPPECAGIDDKTLQRFATELLQQQLGSPTP